MLSVASDSNSLPIKTWSIRTVLFFLLVPIIMGFTILAWLIHGALLEKATESLIEHQLESQGVALEKKLHLIMKQEEPALLLKKYLEDHSYLFHGLAVKINSRIMASTLWGPVLKPALELIPENVDGFVYRTISLPEPANLIIYSKKIQLLNDELVLFIAEDITQLKASNLILHNRTALVFLGLACILLILIVVTVNIALKPVGKIRTSLNDLQAGIVNRIPSDTVPEFKGLVDQINHLLHSLEQRLQESRQAIADLSHSIKTPVAAIHHMLTDFDFYLDKDSRTRLANKLTDIDIHLEIEMHRLHFGGPQSGTSTKPVSQARELLWMLDRLHNRKEFELNTIIDEDRYWPIEEQDFNDIIGNLTDNAGKWANHSVTVSISENNFHYIILVEDDGAGVDDENLDKIGSRSVRLSHDITGHGLGLSIVMDIVNRYQGTVNFFNNGFGGFSAEVELPKTVHINDQR
jgi:two-component system sensor histidine kinase PhoQ